MLETQDDPKSNIKELRRRRQQRQRLHSLHCYVARSGVVAVAASASMLTRQVENIVQLDGSGSTVSLGSDGDAIAHADGAAPVDIVNIAVTLKLTILRVAAWVGGMVKSLAREIGEPPQRVFAQGELAAGHAADAVAAGEEQDAPLLLFWAINLCTICMLASLVLFLSAFWGMPDTMDVPSPSGTSDSLSGIVDSKKLDGPLRVVGVVSLSLLSGCGLGLRHPLQSALLQGL